MREGQGGFSLVEVLAALSLLGIAVVVLALAFDSVLGLKERGEDLTILSVLAQEKMESITSGIERAEEGNYPSPWQDIHWRLYRDASSEGLSVWRLRLTRRDDSVRTLYQLSTAQPENARE